MKRTAPAIVLLLLWASTTVAQQALFLKPNADVLRCRMPDEVYRFVGSNGPGQIFLPGEPVNIKLAFAKGQDQRHGRNSPSRSRRSPPRDPEATDQGGASPTPPATPR